MVHRLFFLCSIAPNHRTQRLLPTAAPSFDIKRKITIPTPFRTASSSGTSSARDDGGDSLRRLLFLRSPGGGSGAAARSGDADDHQRGHGEDRRVRGGQAVDRARHWFGPLRGNWHGSRWCPSLERSQSPAYLRFVCLTHLISISS